MTGARCVVVAASGLAFLATYLTLPVFYPYVVLSMNEPIINALRCAMRQPAVTLVDVAGSPLRMVAMNATLWFIAGAAVGRTLLSFSPQNTSDSGDLRDEE